MLATIGWHETKRDEAVNAPLRDPANQQLKKLQTVPCVFFDPFIAALQPIALRVVPDRRPEFLPIQ